MSGAAAWLQERWPFGAAIILMAITLWLIAAPPRWWLNLTKPVDLGNPVATGETLVAEYGCRDCHRIDGQGALTAPNLSGVTERLDDASLRLWMRNPRAFNRSMAMPNFHLSDSEIEAIAAYLAALDRH